jgi:SAM-dependent methyltransferase
LFSFAAETMGAAEVVGIDNDLSKPATEFLIPFFKSKVRMLEQNLYDLKSQQLGLFEVILFPGVLYHLRYPFWGLKILRDMLKPNGELLIETPIWRGDPNNAMLFCPIGEDSPYEPTSCTFFNEKGLIDTLLSLAFDVIGGEYLNDPPAARNDASGATNAMRNLTRGGLRSLIPARVQKLIRVIRDGNNHPPKITSVTRAVFHFRFRGRDKDTWFARYWEGSHQFHSQGGC